MADFSISAVSTPEDLADVRRLFDAYAASLSVDLAYQGFKAEVAGLPGRFAPPTGALLIARRSSGEAIGCVALRALEQPGTCEMKRLYVTPEGRGLGLGRALAEAAADRARDLGHRELHLDTLPDMTAAQSLYARMGFEPVAAYYDTPVDGTVFLRKKLERASPAGGPASAEDAD